LATDRQTNRQTDKQTNEEMNSIDALSRSRCHERRLNKCCHAEQTSPCAPLQGRSLGEFNGMMSETLVVYSKNFRI